jgi:hypothetical protein
LLSNDAISGDVKAAPSLIPASPKALESVCITTKFGHSATHSAREDPSGAKSIYASSNTTTPFHVGCSSIRIKSSFLTREPVGFPGEQRYINLILEASGPESVEVIAGTSISNSGAGSNGTFTSPTSFTCAETEYMPYVGGQTRILSRAGTQKQRSRASIASSLPTPTNKFVGVMAFLV